MVHERNVAVGCGISQYASDDGWQNTLIACNYAYTNMIGEPIFIKGPVAASNCTKKNPSYLALCAVGEKIKA